MRQSSAVVSERGAIATRDTVRPQSGVQEVSILGFGKPAVRECLRRGLRAAWFKSRHRTKGASKTKQQRRRLRRTAVVGKRAEHWIEVDEVAVRAVREAATVRGVFNQIVTVVGLLMRSASNVTRVMQSPARMEYRRAESEGGAK